MHKHEPKVSVIMGIYNCSEPLQYSINSIMDQSYTNMELIMCDDGSTDDTFSIAKKYADEFHNITVLQNERNYGLAYSLNKCLEFTKGEYIARQDGDDRSTTFRFEKQVQVLDAYDEFDIVKIGRAHV